MAEQGPHDVLSLDLVLVAGALGVAWSHRPQEAPVAEGSRATSSKGEACAGNPQGRTHARHI
eukprot:2755054-Pyramimonas_sp.AAC.1